MKFPKLSILDYFNYSLEYEEILEILEDSETKELEYKFMDLVDKINEMIIIRYYSKHVFNALYLNLI